MILKKTMSDSDASDPDDSNNYSDFTDYVQLPVRKRRKTIADATKIRNCCSSDAECPRCFDPILRNSNRMYVQCLGCYRCFHHSCMQEWKATKHLHNLGKRKYAEKKRYEEQEKKVAELEKEINLYVLETMEKLLEKYMELNKKISPKIPRRFPRHSTVHTERFFSRKNHDDDDDGEVIYKSNTDRFAALMYEIVHLLEQIELLPGGWNFFQRPPYQRPESHQWHNDPTHPEYQHNHEQAEHTHFLIMRDAALAVEAVHGFRILNKITAEDNAKLKKYESEPPFPIKYTTTPWRDPAPFAKPDTRPLDWRNRLDWYSMKGVENEGMKGIENEDSSISISLKEIPSEWRSRGRMENLLASLQSAWRLLLELQVDVRYLEDDENQGDQWSCPLCRLNWTEHPPLQATCPGGEGMQGSSRSFGNLIKAKQHIQKSLHYLNM